MENAKPTTEPIYPMKYSELVNIVSFILNHDWDEIPKSIQDKLGEYHEFIADKL